MFTNHQLKPTVYRPRLPTQAAPSTSHPATALAHERPGPGAPGRATREPLAVEEPTDPVGAYAE